MTGIQKNKGKRRFCKERRGKEGEDRKKRRKKEKE